MLFLEQNTAFLLLFIFGHIFYYPLKHISLG